MRAWKKYVKLSKERRVADDRALEQWAIGIHFYEQSLMTKAYLGLQQSKNKRQ